MTCGWGYWDLWVGLLGPVGEAIGTCGWGYWDLWVRLLGPVGGAIGIVRGGAVGDQGMGLLGL